METRVKKFKAYRESIINGDALTPEQAKDDRMIVGASTSTLPIDQVIKATGNIQENTKTKKSFNKNIIFIAIGVLVSVILIAGLVILGYFAWR